MRYLIVCLIISLASCNGDDAALPKPRIYPRVQYPEKSFKSFEQAECPFTMQIPAYTIYMKDTLKTREEEKYTCWFDLFSPELNAKMHMSYIDFSGRQRFDELVEDAFEMVDKHNIKAYYRDEIKLSFPEKNLYGLIFEIDGPVASPLQFYLTDSTNHFLRGSLYFNDVVNRDSIEPVYHFIRQDIEPMFESFSWTK